MNYLLDKPMIPISLWDWDNINSFDKCKSYYGFAYVFLDDEWWPVSFFTDQMD